MEAVGARLGRSSSRYGTTTLFNGPVRKWKKKWVQVAPSSNHNSNHHSSLANGNSTASSHLLLYKWTPISQSNKENTGNSNTGENKTPDDAPASETPPRRKFRYIPVATLEEQKKDTEDNSDDEGKAITDTDTNAEELASKSDDRYENPDINDVPMDENQAATIRRDSDGVGNACLHLHSLLTRLALPQHSSLLPQPLRSYILFFATLDILLQSEFCSRRWQLDQRVVASREAPIEVVLAA